MKKCPYCAVVSLLVLLLVACSPSTPSASAIETAMAQTQTAMPTIANIALPASTRIPEPTSTAETSNTPNPTNTPGPTNTPRPTNTPTEPPTPTSTPKPILLTGKGSDIVDVEIPFDLAIGHITGNKASNHFSIVSYDKNGNYVDLLVNTSDPYDGVVPIGFEGNQITRFEVDAVGAWTIEILPLSSARSFSIPGKIEGTGNDVVVMTDGVPDIAEVTGNKQADHYSIVGYDLNGNYIDLLVNTSDPFEGKVLLENGIAVLVIDAVGSWTINVTTR